MLRNGFNGCGSESVPVFLLCLLMSSFCWLVARYEASGIDDGMAAVAWQRLLTFLAEDTSRASQLEELFERANENQVVREREEVLEGKVVVWCRVVGGCVGWNWGSACCHSGVHWGRGLILLPTSRSCSLPSS